MTARRYSNLVDMVRRQAERHGDAPAYVFLDDGEDQETRTSYAQLERRARAIATLLERHGDAGDRRALLLYEPGPRYVEGYFGTLFAGWTPVPAYPPIPSRLTRTLPRVLSILADSRAGAILTTSAIKPVLEHLLASVPGVSQTPVVATDEAAESAADGWREPVGDHDIGLLQFTSGSVAEPKGVLVTHANLLDNIEWIRRIGGDSPRPVSWLPPYHDMGLIGAILYPIYAGGFAVLMSPLHFLSRPFRWLRGVTRHQGNMVVGPNFGYQLCVRKILPEQRELLDLSSLEVAWNGAEPVRAEVLREFASYFGPCGFKESAFYPCYGLAEATLLVSGGDRGAMPLARSFSSAELGRGIARQTDANDESVTTLVSVGRSRGEGEIRIVEPSSRTPVEDGTVGEIWLRSPSVCRGYWQRPELTETTFGARTSAGEGPYLRTGDLGFIVDGQLFIAGRLKDLIVIRGRNVYPQDIERTCESAHAWVRPGSAAAFGADCDGEERLVVALEVEPGRVPRDAPPSQGEYEAIAQTLRRAISASHDIAVYAILLLKAGSIPKTSSGKIQRHAARVGYLGGALDVLYSSSADML
jgi:acyl-CoA synthetase (AMP-forming)/AMP-acid ligase II